MKLKEKRRAPRGKNGSRVKDRGYRWFIVKEETWAKVERIKERMESEGLYPGRLTINKVASIEFEKAIASIPE